MKILYRFAMLLLGAVLGLACNGPAVEYGMPHARYRVSGTVVTRRQHQPIPGIVVTLNNRAITTSDTTGAWSLDSFSFYDGSGCELKFGDPDGPANGGQFAARTITVQARQTAAGNDGWYHGQFESNGNEIELDGDTAPR